MQVDGIEGIWDPYQPTTATLPLPGMWLCHGARHGQVPAHLWPQLPTAMAVRAQRGATAPGQAQGEAGGTLSAPSVGFAGRGQEVSVQPGCTRASWKQARLARALLTPQGSS